MKSSFLKSIIKSFVYTYKIGIETIRHLFFEYQIITRTAFTKTDTQNKLLTAIILQTHVLEKGLSYRFPKKAFGIDRVQSLIVNLNEHILKYGYHEILDWTIHALESYFKVNIDSIEVKKIETMFNKIVDNISWQRNQSIEGGTLTLKKDDIVQSANIDFLKFLRSRHSIRYFKKKDVDENILSKAIDMSKYTPSACNRQCWNVHVYRGYETCSKILEFQGGGRGMITEINTIILITGDMNRFSPNTLHQAYIDGALYSMTLMYALHSLGLATIPLNSSFDIKRKKIFHKTFDVPINETPIMFVAIGHYEDVVNVPLSFRLPGEHFTKYHENIKL